MPVYHILLMRLKPDADPDRVQEWREKAHGMVGQIPGLIDMQVGPPTGPSRGKGFDLGSVVTLESVDVLPVFIKHPAHKPVHHLYQEVCEPSATIVYDFEFGVGQLPRKIKPRPSLLNLYEMTFGNSVVRRLRAKPSMQDIESGDDDNEPRALNEPTHEVQPKPSLYGVSLRGRKLRPKPSVGDFEPESSSRGGESQPSGGLASGAPSGRVSVSTSAAQTDEPRLNGAIHESEPEPEPNVPERGLSSDSPIRSLDGPIPSLDVSLPSPNFEGPLPNFDWPMPDFNVPLVDDSQRPMDTPTHAIDEPVPGSDAPPVPERLRPSLDDVAGPAPIFNQPVPLPTEPVHNSNEQLMRGFNEPVQPVQPVQTVQMVQSFNEPVRNLNEPIRNYSYNSEPMRSYSEPAHMPVPIHYVSGPIPSFEGPVHIINGPVHIINGPIHRVMHSADGSPSFPDSGYDSPLVSHSGPVLRFDGPILRFDGPVQNFYEPPTPSSSKPSLYNNMGFTSSSGRDPEPHYQRSSQRWLKARASGSNLAAAAHNGNGNGEQHRELSRKISLYNMAFGSRDRERERERESPASVSVSVSAFRKLRTKASMSNFEHSRQSSGLSSDENIGRSSRLRSKPSLVGMFKWSRKGGAAAFNGVHSHGQEMMVA